MSPLAALAHAYERMAERGEVPPFGYSTQKIAYVIALNADGSSAAAPAFCARVPSLARRLLPGRGEQGPGSRSLARAGHPAVAFFFLSFFPPSARGAVLFMGSLPLAFGLGLSVSHCFPAAFAARACGHCGW